MPEENQHARDSAELRRLCSERDQLRHKVAEQAREIAEANADFIRKANEAEQLRAELADSATLIEKLEFDLEVAKTDELSAAIWAATETIKHELWDAQAKLAAAKETITRYETTAENCDLLRAELAALREQVPTEYQQLSRYGNWDRIERDVFDLAHLSVCPERLRKLYAAPVVSAEQHGVADAGLVEILTELVGAASSVNKGRQHEVRGLQDSEPCYWQRKEWVDWLVMLGEKGRSALAAYRSAPAPSTTEGQV